MNKTRQLRQGDNFYLTSAIVLASLLLLPIAIHRVHVGNGGPVPGLAQRPLLGHRHLPH
jgi:hypothetical protein